MHSLIVYLKTVSRQLKIPPITNKNTITAISETFLSAPSTKIGDSAHFQNGIPPPEMIKVSPADIYSSIRINIRVYVLHNIHVARPYI